MLEWNINENHKGKNCKIKIMLNINYNKSSGLNTFIDK